MFTFHVVPDTGEPYDLTVASRDVVMWEKIDRKHTITRLETDPSMTDLYSVTCVAAKRQGLFRGVLAEWETSVDLVPVVEEESPSEEGPSDPTQPGHLPGSLSRSL